ncbi:uncharacterized protein LOC114303531 [Camellia sinensis]|uniref:uncharacterized protein LOC114303531 n=1 Tax=Camellia sinensis TaxID=4442 RepID=UPI001036DB91|nr:uncharacterized protein LOC114303531 [Camellia sinensis]
MEDELLRKIRDEVETKPKPGFDFANSVLKLQCRLCVPKLTTKKIKTIRERLKTTQSRQKSYADHRRRDLEFEISSHVFVKATPMKGHPRFSKMGKLTSRYVGPFQILEKVSSVAYRVALPLSMGQVHNVFHVSVLRGYLPDPSHVIDYHQITLDDKLTYEETPIRILDRQLKQLHNWVISMVKVEWQEHYGTEAT